MSAIVNGMFAVKILYNAGCVAALTSIEGRRYDSASKVWFFPVNALYRVANAVRPFFPMVSDRLEKSPRYQEVRDAIAVQRNAVQLSYATEATNFPIPHPRKLDYYGYQYAGIKFAYDTYKRGEHGCLIGDDLGVGKTIQFLGLVNKIKSEQTHFPKTLIICPASLKQNWRREAQTWLMQKPRIMVIDSDTPEFLLTKQDVVIINYDILKKFFDALFAIPWELVCMDEAHYIKSQKAQRSSAACTLVTNTAGRKHPFLVEMTGTPIVNRPAELWHLLHCIDPKKWSSFSSYAQRYCIVSNFRGRMVVTGAKNMDELHHTLRSGYMIRRLKKDVLKDLPPKRRQIIELGRTKYEKVLRDEEKVRAIYEQYVRNADAVERGLARAVAQGDDANAEAYRAKVASMGKGDTGGWGEIMRVRHMTALAKVPECCKFIDQILEEKDKVVVFAHHRDVIENIAEHFKGQAVILYGGMSSEEKDNSVQKFLHNDACRVFIGSIKAAGVGLTLTVADTAVFCELDFSPSNNTQAEDRINRIGQKSCTSIYHLVIQDSIDVHIAKRAIEKQEIIDQALDNKTAKTSCQTSRKAV